MSCGSNACYPGCPATTVMIQPPPFVLSIPGPSICCPSEPLCIEQCNPCAPAIEYNEGPTQSVYGSISTAVGSISTSRSSQRALPRSQRASNPPQRYQGRDQLFRE